MQTSLWVLTQLLHVLMRQRIAPNAVVKGTQAICVLHKCVLFQAVVRSMLLCVTPVTLSRFFCEESVDELRTHSA